VPLLHPGRLARAAAPGLLDDHPEGGVYAGSIADRLAADADTVTLLVMGRDRADGRIELGHHHRLHVRWDAEANLPLYAAEAAACSEIAGAVGARLSLPGAWRYLGQTVSVHNLGGCRMAEDPSHGVVDPDGRVFGYPGLYVLDGAILPTATGANPSSTIAAVAERCIERAIRRMAGTSTWRAPEASTAVRILPPEDVVVVPEQGTPPVRGPSGGVRYAERIAGLVPVAGVPRRFAFTVTSTAPDVGRLLDDPVHPLALAGRVWVEGVTGPGGEPIRGGVFHLLTETGDLRARKMSYELPFHSPTDGTGWVLRGVKDVRGRRVRALWRSLTTIAVSVAPLPGSDVLEGSGRLGLAGVARMLVSLRIVGGDGRVGAAGGLLRFGLFFASSVWSVYRAGRRWRA
jgi:cholesterol oxidase